VKEGGEQAEGGTIAYTGRSTMGKRGGSWAHMKTRADIIALPPGDACGKASMDRCTWAATCLAMML
jgi:hypothetical protein